MSSDGRPWRKLQRLERASHRLWTVTARAVRDHLLRLPDDTDGVIFSSTDDPIGDLLIALNAHEEERDEIGKALEFLLDDGYLVHESGCLSIRNFDKEQADEADKKRSDSAERKRRQRERERERAAGSQDARDHGVTCHATVTGHVTDPVTVTSRSIKKRREEKRLPVTRDCDRVTCDESQSQQSTSQQSPTTLGKIACPADLRLATEQRSTLEASMVPGWAIDAITTDFVSTAIADQGDLRQLVHWRKCLSRAISGRWNDPAKRPKRPSEQASGEPEGWVTE